MTEQESDQMWWWFDNLDEEEQTKIINKAFQKVRKEEECLQR